MGKYVVYVYTVECYSDLRNHAICDMDELGKHCTKWNKADMKGQILWIHLYEVQMVHLDMCTYILSYVNVTTNHEKKT